MKTQIKRSLVSIIAVLLAAFSASSFPASVTGKVTYLNFDATTGLLSTTVGGVSCSLPESIGADTVSMLGNFLANAKVNGRTITFDCSLHSAHY